MSQLRSGCVYFAATGQPLYHPEPSLPHNSNMTRVVALPALVLALLVLPMCSGNDGTVTGKVYFGVGDVDLPDGAVVTVKLLDISYADAPSMTLGEHVIEDAGSLPVQFRISYDKSAIDDRNDYSLSARIELDGRLLYINDTVHSVLTRNNPGDRDIEVIKIER